MKRVLRKLLGGLGIRIDGKKGGSVPLSMYYSLFGKEDVEKRRFYNIGAGSFSHPAWTNIDYLSDWYRENREKTLKGIHHDLLSLDRIPVEDGSAAIVYSSHTVEHITDEAAEMMFREAYRILRKGGVFRLTTPDIFLSYNAYRTGDRSFFYWAGRYSRPEEMERVNLEIPMNRASVAQLFIYSFATSASTIVREGAGAPKRISDEELEDILSERELSEALDYCTSLCPIEIQRRYPGNHINWWSAEKAERMLREAGFERVYRSGWGQSLCPVLRDTDYFDNTHPKISLYMEAIK